MTDFMMTKLDPNTSNVPAGECTKVYHTVQHVHSYRSADCDMKLRQTAFSDSDIVKKLSCGRTKAEAIVSGVLAPASIDDSLGILHRNMIEIEEEDLTPYFSIASDAHHKMVCKIECFIFIPILKNLLGYSISTNKQVRKKLIS
jgi:hypothetical protein